MTAPTTTRRSGRPRDPDVDHRLLTAARTILAEQGLDGFTADAIAAAGHLGKAAIYRRFGAIDELLAAVVSDLGVTDVGLHPPGPGELRHDLARLLHAATGDESAAAEANVLSAVGRSEQLQAAYLAGPERRFVLAMNSVEVRGRRRGERAWPSASPVLAARSALLRSLQLEGSRPYYDQALHVVDDVVVPALCCPRGAVA